MPNLGRGFSLGALYDARTDERIEGFLWPLHVLKDPKYVKDLNAKKSKYSMVYDDTFKDKASLLEVSSELALKSRSSSHGIGTKGSSKFKLGGSAEFMTKSKASSRQVKASVAYKLRSFQQVLDVFHPDVKRQMHPQVVAAGKATHVVAGITYGSNCIATFTYTSKSLKEKTVAKAFLETKMSAMGRADAPFGIAGAKAKTSMESELETKFRNMEFSTSSGITVDILGDVVPLPSEQLPTTVDEGIDFLKRLHKHGLVDGGVPMDLTLVPIEWLDSNAAKLARKLDSNTIDEAFRIVMELDSSVESLNELLEIDGEGFLAWQASLQDEILLLEQHRANVTQEISEAIDLFRDGGDTSALTAAFNAYHSGSFHSAAMAVLAEQKRDEIRNLKAMVSSLKQQAAVPTAEHFSDYMAPSLDQSFDRVYTLLVTGMNPARFRSSLGLVKDFTAYAASFLVSRSPTTWCKTAIADGNADTCVETYHFGAIHFDSFCEHFCSPQYCTPAPRECTDPVASAALSFNASDRDAWCQNPCTAILGFWGNRGPFRADNAVEVLPGEPTITSVVGSGDVQLDPYKQKVTLQVQPSTRGTVTNWRVRTSWLERTEEDSSSSGWAVKHTTFDTMDDTPTVVVRKLVAGRKYTFEVAGINMVGVGPFSDEYRLANGKMLRIAYPMATISSEFPWPVPRNNSGPGWKPWRVRVKISVPGEEAIGQVLFERHGDGFTISCTEIKDATTSEATCLLPAQARQMAGDEYYQVIVKNMEGDEIFGRGNFTLESQTGRSCYETEWETRVLCNATQLCVRSCQECLEVDFDPSGAIIKRNTTAVWQTHTCLYDVCPDSGGLASTHCPNPMSPYPCFIGGSTMDCRSNCHLESVYYPTSGMCALPCHINLAGPGLSQACASLVPGELCNLGCKPGWVITDGNGHPVPFTCPVDNAQLNYQHNDLTVQAPTCAATCSLFTCPAGWNSNSAYDSRIGTTKEQCCDEIVCDSGKYGPDLQPACPVCSGESRRRRASMCTNCVPGYVVKAGDDDCQPYCATVTCQSGYDPRPNKDTLTGSQHSDCCYPSCNVFTCPTGWTDKSNKVSIAGAKTKETCCDEVVCGNGQYRNLYGNNCLTCNGQTNRRRNTNCDRCASGYVNAASQDDCKPWCATQSCPDGWWEKHNKATIAGTHYTHCCDEVTCPGGYYTRRRAASCDKCHGDTRRRRATSCGGCAMNYVNRDGHDACTKQTSQSGYTLRAACTGSNLEHTTGRSIAWCASRCNGWNANRWPEWAYPRCIGFGFNFYNNQCALKSSCSQQGGSPNLNSWHHWQKNR